MKEFILTDLKLSEVTVNVNSLGKHEELKFTRFGRNCKVEVS
jgi:hypothetical protein